MPVLSRLFGAGRSTSVLPPARSCRRPRGAPATSPSSVPVTGHCPAMDGTNPASGHSPTGPVLRANPFPEVTDLICRLPLPTLFYRLEAVHLGDLLRISVRAGTKIKLPPSGFHGPNRAHGTPQEPRRFAETTSLSPAEPFPGSPFLKQKRELCPRLYPAYPSLFALPRRALAMSAHLRVQVREY